MGLRDPSSVDAIKADMVAGSFRFTDPEGQIGGVLDPSGVYHVMEGPASVVFQQAGNRMHAQKAILEWLLKG